MMERVALSAGRCGSECVEYSLKDLLLVADCNYHVFFKTDVSNISGLPYEEIKKEQLKNYLDMTVLRVDQDWNITIG